MRCEPTGMSSAHGVIHVVGQIVQQHDFAVTPQTGKADAACRITGLDLRRIDPRPPAT